MSASSRPTLRPRWAKAHGQVHRHRRLAHPALAAGDGDHLADDGRAPASAMGESAGLRLFGTRAAALAGRFAVTGQVTAAPSDGQHHLGPAHARHGRPARSAPPREPGRSSGACGRGGFEHECRPARPGPAGPAPAPPLTSPCPSAGPRPCPGRRQDCGDGGGSLVQS